MDAFIKELKLIANDGGTITIWAAIGATIIFLLVLYFITSRGNSKPSSYMGRGSHSHPPLNMENDYFKPSKDQKQLGGERVYTNQSINSNQIYPNKIDNLKEGGSSKSMSNTENTSVVDYRDNESQIKYSANEDGTVSTEIIFDSKNSINEPTPFSPKYEYLETANDGQFRKLLPSDEKSFFRTWEENGTRKFEFHGNVERALANINAIFDDVCEIEGKQNGATQIDNVEPGILSSQLKVEKKAIIKLT